MFIGPVRFDVELRQLVNTESAQALKLSNIEFLVINELISFRGQVVSTESMCTLLLPKVVTAQDITIAITNIKAFLGANTASMIEVVTNQGYLLHVKSRRLQMHSSPYAAFSIKQFSLLLLLGVMLVIFLATHFKTTENIRFSLPEQILLDGKSSVLVPIYNSDAELDSYQSKFREVAIKLEQCEAQMWDKIYTSASPSGDMLHFVMQAENDKVMNFENLKVLNVGDSWNFINDSWLQEYGLCE
ncbi:CadC family transcriptional regulator [Shewanella sp. c952]|uniref:helix-turn-helix domain-containing protein n=1 Tax=Shewanella sp. c952 TaxID=2815913 RepID=UPI001BBCCB6C|nr:helix-turn-helix domain-containing protein [Shewanella sp. c952]GIU14458.1 CadC family transcriptional regulator [Shewanella sp. c952]